MKRWWPASLRRPGPHVLGATLGLIPFVLQPFLARGAETLGPALWSRAGFLVSVFRVPGRWLLQWVPWTPPTTAADVPPALVDQGTLIAVVVLANLIGWWLAVVISVVLGDVLRPNGPPDSK